MLGSRLNEIATFDYAIPAPGPDVGARRSRAARRHARPAAPDHRRRGRRPQLPALGHRAAEGRCPRERPWSTRSATANAADRERFEAASVVDAEPWSGPGVHPGRIVATLAEVLPPDTILTTDAGNFASWAARGYRFRRPATFLGPTSGAMGYGLPAAIAAALARPNRPSIALAGDGGFAMTMSELETAVRERARVVAIVFDNQRYGTIRAHQERRGKGVIGTDLGPIDFAAAAQAFGARGVHVESDEQFEPALREALAQGGPTVLHLTLDRRWLAIDHVLEADPRNRRPTLDEERGPMKITAIEPFVCDGGLRQFGFLKVTTDEGIVGWSEIYDFTAVASLATAIRIIGRSSSAWTRSGSSGSTSGCGTSRDPGSRNGSRSLRRLDIALWDIKGKALGVPVYELLGGKFHDRLKLYWSHFASYRGAWPEIVGVDAADDLPGVGRGRARRRGGRATRSSRRT